MRNEFKTFLISKGMTSKSSERNTRGTSEDYAWRIFNIAKFHGMSWEVLSQNLNVIMPKYMPGGEFQDYGKRSHESFINALRYFREFVGSQLKNSKTPTVSQNKRKWLWA